MELKCRKAAGLSSVEEGFNRTFMELKSSQAQLETQRKQVLIVPLWN